MKEKTMDFFEDGRIENFGMLSLKSIATYQSSTAHRTIYHLRKSLPIEPFVELGMDGAARKIVGEVQNFHIYKSMIINTFQIHHTSKQQIAFGQTARVETAAGSKG